MLCFKASLASPYASTDCVLTTIHTNMSVNIENVLDIHCKNGEKSELTKKLEFTNVMQ